MANWETIWSYKQRLIAKNNKAENMKWIKYEYQVDQKVLVMKNQPNKLSMHYDEPYKIVEVWPNDTVTIHKPARGGAVLETIYIWGIHPYQE